MSKLQLILYCMTSSVQSVLSTVRYLKQLEWEFYHFWRNILQTKLISNNIEGIFYKTLNVLFSIKRTVLKIFKSSLLNVPYDLKIGGLNIYKTGTYNREHRVLSPQIGIVLIG